MQVTVQQLAEMVQGKVHGDGELLIHAARPLEDAGPDDITFLENKGNLRKVRRCRARAALIPARLVSSRNTLLSTSGERLTLIEVSDALLAFVKVVQFLQGVSEPVVHGIDPLASVHPTARIGRDASIHPFAVVGEGAILGDRCRLHSGAIVGRSCLLGDDVILYPHAVLYDGIRLGHRVILHAGAVIGADGFGYRMQQGRHVKVPQLGSVEIGDDVEIGAGTTIDRGTFQATRIGAGTKIDNLVQVGHNCKVGQHNLFVSQVGIAGSTTTGDYVVLAGQVGVADHVHIGDQALIGARSGVARDVAPGDRVLGTPARPEAEEKRIMFSVERLPALLRDVRHIKQHLGLTEERPSHPEASDDAEGGAREAG